MDIALHIFRSPAFASIAQEACRFFCKTPISPLPPPDPFEGGGVYALYYVGTRFQYYSRLADANRAQISKPIYVGKAVAPGWRTARASLDPNAQTLFMRLREHARSIEQTNNLDVADFKARFMILDGSMRDLVVPVEAELIRQFKPLWNSVIDGFGNHDPGSGRYNQAASEWDVLHPGRSWAARLTGEAPQLRNIIQKIQNYRA